MCFAAPAEAAKITWGNANFSNPVYTCDDGNTICFAFVQTQPNEIVAFAKAAYLLDNPGNINLFDVNATVHQTFSSSFTVDPTSGEAPGDKIYGSLFGRLDGRLKATGSNLGVGFGSYSASVQASVNAGFADWTNPSTGSSISGSNPFTLANTRIDFPFRIKRELTVGETYPFEMNLTINASKNGPFTVESRFLNTFSADVQAVPGPLPVLGLGAFFGYSRKLRKRIQLSRSQPD